ncbi:MAG: hypothetical protein GVY29_09435 [Spirochaetes bacterium]|nr:hypothetical protein [Spirochaetota bacterium]
MHERGCLSWRRRAKRTKETSTTIFDGTHPIELKVTVTEVGPVFTWEDSGRPSVFVAVFAGMPIVVENKIRNEETLVWAWHSGLGSGLPGRVEYRDGIAVIDGEFHELSEDLAPLTPGIYRAALWSYNERGELADSSEITEFTVPAP